MRRTRLGVLVGCGLSVAGCAHQGTLAAEIIVIPAPPEVDRDLRTYQLPDGEVRIAMLPMVRLPALWTGQQATRALHVRVTFANVGLQAWTVFPRRQLAQMGQRGSMMPAATSLDPVVVAPGEMRTLDLYYPIPLALPSRLTLEWQVQRPGVTVAGETQIDPTLAWAPRSWF
jgi:hypothetical protein